MLKPISDYAPSVVKYNTYDCSAPFAPGVPGQRIEAPSSLEARKRYAAGHSGMSHHDVIAVRR